MSPPRRPCWWAWQTACRSSSTRSGPGLQASTLVVLMRERRVPSSPPFLPGPPRLGHFLCRSWPDHFDRLRVLLQDLFTASFVPFNPALVLQTFAERVHEAVLRQQCAVRAVMYGLCSCPSSCTGRRTPRTTNCTVFPVPRRDPRDAILTRKTVAIRAHVRQCDPALPHVDPPQEVSALCKTCCTMLLRWSSCCSACQRLASAFFVNPHPSSPRPGLIACRTTLPRTNKPLHSRNMASSPVWGVLLIHVLPGRNASAASSAA